MEDQRDDWVEGWKIRGMIGLREEDQRDDWTEGGRSEG